MAKIPFQATEPKGFSLLPSGTYCLLIEDVEETTSKNDNPMLKVTQVIESDDQFNGRKVMRWFPTGGGGAFRLRALVEAAIPDKVEITETGEKDDKDNPIADVVFDTDDLIGARYFADCYTKKDEQRGQVNDWRNEKPFEAAANGDEAVEEEEETETEEESESAEDAPAPAAKPETKKAAPAAAGKPAAGKPAAAAGKPAANTKPANGGGKTNTAPAAAAGGRTRERMKA